ncbi:MAG: hypothetical protein AVO33_01130 [delta proteobacterium ML8_F1]|nr:MAG: hypothetical protein AVO33_01130 [delta proteobacterium ML8_F1]
MNNKKLITILCLISGTVSLMLGITGIILPILPTTPFLLLASFCYLRSSRRMYVWLLTHRFFGAYLYAYITYKAIPGKTKLSAVIFLWLSLLASMMVVPRVPVILLLSVVGGSVTYHILSLKTLTRDQTLAMKKWHDEQNGAGVLSGKI